MAINDHKYISLYNFNIPVHIFLIYNSKLYFFSLGEGQETRSYSHKQLRLLVGKYAAALKHLNVGTGDRVAGW